MKPEIRNEEIIKFQYHITQQLINVTNRETVPIYMPMDTHHLYIFQQTTDLHTCLHLPKFITITLCVYWREERKKRYFTFTACHVTLERLFQTSVNFFFISTGGWPREERKKKRLKKKPASATWCNNGKKKVIRMKVTVSMSM